MIGTSERKIFGPLDSYLVLFSLPDNEQEDTFIQEIIVIFQECAEGPASLANS